MMEPRRRGRSGLDKLLAVMAGAELSKGGHSWLERSFLDLLGELGPRPITSRSSRRAARSSCGWTVGFEPT